MPEGKPAGVRCVNLDAENRCSIYGSRDYPAVCRNFAASEEMCGADGGQAREYLIALEALTAPSDGGREEKIKP
jgi:hypothetical protein